MNKSSEVLNELNIKITEPRKVITDIMVKTKKHLTIDDIMVSARKKLPNIGIATAYRVLKILEDNGIVEKHIFSETNIIYENIYAKEHHYHVINIDNDNVTEFYDPKLEKLIENYAKENKYDLVSHNIKVFVKNKK